MRICDVLFQYICVCTSYSELLSKFGDNSFQKYVSIEISHPVFYGDLGSVPVDFLRPKFWVAHTEDDIISILMHKYTYTNMYIIKKIICCRFILCSDITSLFKPYEKSCRRRRVKIEKI